LNVFVDLNVNEVYIIFSEARGGSTWLMELVKRHLICVTIWEPLHPKRGLISDKFGDRPLFSGNNDDELKDKLSTLFEGKTVNYWVLSKESKKLTASIKKIIY
jgi:hypothetical protein